MHVQQGQLTAQRIGVRLDRVLGHGIGPVERRPTLPAGLGTDVDDPPSTRAQQGEEGLVDAVGAEHIDLEQPAEGLLGHLDHRPDGQDAGEVHHAVQAIDLA